MQRWEHRHHKENDVRLSQIHGRRLLKVKVWTELNFCRILGTRRLSRGSPNHWWTHFNGDETRHMEKLQVSNMYRITIKTKHILSNLLPLYSIRDNAKYCKTKKIKTMNRKAGRVLILITTLKSRFPIFQNLLVHAFLLLSLLNFSFMMKRQNIHRYTEIGPSCLVLSLEMFLWLNELCHEVNSDLWWWWSRIEEFSCWYMRLDTCLNLPLKYHRFWKQFCLFYKHRS